VPRAPGGPKQSAESPRKTRAGTGIFLLSGKIKKSARHESNFYTNGLSSLRGKIKAKNRCATPRNFMGGGLLIRLGGVRGESRPFQTSNEAPKSEGAGGKRVAESWRLGVLKRQPLDRREKRGELEPKLPTRQHQAAAWYTNESGYGRLQPKGGRATKRGRGILPPAAHGENELVASEPRTIY